MMSDSESDGFEAEMDGLGDEFFNDRIDSIIESLEPGIKQVFYDSQQRYSIKENLGWSEESKGITLCLVSVHDGHSAQLILKDSWAHAESFTVDIEINIVGVKASEGRVYVIDRNNGYLIVDPNKLISVTSIMGSFFCERKTIYTETARLPFDNLDAFRGIVAHELIGRGMQLPKSQQNSRTVKLILESVITSPPILLKAYGLGLNSSGLLELGNSLIPFVLKFLVQKFWSKKSLDGEKGSLQIETLIDIEDNFWNPNYGLKGKLDATVVMKDRLTNKISIGPLEFKTGHVAAAANKNRDSHIGQVQLYSLLMSHRYEDIKKGLLYYIREDNLMEITMQRKLITALIQARNRLALNLSIKDGRKFVMPTPNIDYRFCDKCEFRTMCSLDVAMNGPADVHQNRTERSLIQFLSYLLPAERKFYLHWFTIITLETLAVETKFNSKTLWNDQEEKREKSGKCLAFLTLIHSEPEMDVPNQRILGYSLIFQRLSSAPEINWNALDVKSSDFVTLGSNRDLCITYGTVQSVDPAKGKIVIKTERPINEENRESRCAWFTVDKIQSSSPIAMQYGYLQSFMENTAHAERLREYIIHGKQPEFPPIPRDRILKHGVLDRFNSRQQSAITHAARTDSFLLVKGMPGTGKTETIVGLIELLTKMGFTVLVVAYTGTALDNILIKYSKISEFFLRVGEPRIRHPELVRRTTGQVHDRINDLDVMSEVFNSCPVVGTTLLSLKHEIFRARKFDYLIVDEASQALPTAVLGAFMLANKYILFGDPDQLPTVMTSGGAKGKDESIFNLLTTPTNTKVLTHQYRMNETIMSLANQLVYNGEMKCEPRNKHKVVPLASLRFSNYLDQPHLKSKRPWLIAAGSIKQIKSVVFLDTSRLGAYEVRKDESLMNEIEGGIVEDLIELFVRSNIQANEIGVIAPYRGQVGLVRSNLNKLDSEYETVEVNTVDQYQGRDKTVIICTFTKSRKTENEKINPEPEFNETKGSILEDIRRLNVAITRAKRKLIMIGNMQYLKTIGPFQKLFGCLLPEQIIKLVWNQEKEITAKFPAKSKKETLS